MEYPHQQSFQQQHQKESSPLLVQNTGHGLQQVPPRLDVSQWGSERHSALVEGLESRAGGRVLVRPNGYVFRGPRTKEDACAMVERE